jgi:UDP-N-acetyl-D-mannosaminuronate dehydrogenase
MTPGDFMTLELTTKTSPAEQLLARIRLRTSPVAVIGLGYVGLPLAETFAACGCPT